MCALTLLEAALYTGFSSNSNSCALDRFPSPAQGSLNVAPSVTDLVRYVLHQTNQQTPGISCFRACYSHFALGFLLPILLVSAEKQFTAAAANRGGAL